MRKNASQTSNLVAQSTSSASRLKQQRDSSDPRSEGRPRREDSGVAQGRSVTQSLQSIQVNKRYPGAASSKGGDEAGGDKELTTLQDKKLKMQQEISGLQKQLLAVTQELKQKSTLLDKVKRGKPGAPAPRPPNTAVAPPVSASQTLEPKHESVKVFLDMKDELEQKEEQIEMLNDKLIVQEHELGKLKGLKANLDKLNKLEDELEEKDNLIAELKKKVAVQEEAINAWIEAVDAKKKVVKSQASQIEELLKENELNAGKLVEYLQRIEDLNASNEQLTSSRKVLAEDLDVSKKDLGQEKQKTETLCDRIKALEMQLQNRSTASSDEIDVLKAENLALQAKTSKLEAEVENNKQLAQKMIDEAQQDLDSKTAKWQLELSDELGRLADCEQQRDNWKAEHKSVSDELERFKNAQAAKDKLANSQGDERLQALMRQVADLETERTQLLQQVKNLKQEAVKNQNELQDEKLSKEKSLLSLKQTHQEATSKLTTELQEVQASLMAMVKEEQQKAQNLEQKLNIVLKEKMQLEKQLKDINASIDQIHQKMDEKNKQIQAKQTQIDELENKNVEYMRKIDELNAALRSAKKKTQNEGKDLQDKLKARDSEVEVLKEMVRGSKLQLKSKDTDIQRLTIKIKRLEKTNEIREDMINSIAVNIKNGKDIDPNLLMQPTKAPRAADLRPSPSLKGADLFQTPETGKSLNNNNKSNKADNGRQSSGRRNYKSKNLLQAEEQQNFKLPPISKQGKQDDKMNTEYHDKPKQDHNSSLLAQNGRNNLTKQQRVGREAQDPSSKVSLSSQSSKYRRDPILSTSNYQQDRYEENLPLPVNSESALALQRKSVSYKNHKNSKVILKSLSKQQDGSYFQPTGEEYSPTAYSGQVVGGQQNYTQDYQLNSNQVPYKSRNAGKSMAPESVANITSARQGSVMKSQEDEAASYNEHPAWKINEPESTNEDYSAPTELFGGQISQPKHLSQIQTPTLAHSVAGDGQGTAPHSDENDIQNGQYFDDAIIDPAMIVKRDSD